TSCNVTSHAQKEFYISESNLLRVYWDGSVRDVVLRYEFLPFCSNRTFAGSPFGRFCSTGYPNVIFGCNTVYSIYVPLGFSIELQLNVLGLATGALCQNNTLDVITRNYSIASEVQLMEFCLDASDDPKDSYTLHSFQNTLDIRTFSNTDDLHKGFCATYKAVPQDPLRIVGCDYGWVSGDKFCYKVFGERLRWKEADEACQMKRGRLASITDKGIAHLLDNVIFTSASVLVLLIYCLLFNCILPAPFTREAMLFGLEPTTCTTRTVMNGLMAKHLTSPVSAFSLKDFYESRISSCNS
ncbi:protocadherin Fat 1, partial [Trichonephila inaurata madagascariensis]